MSKKTDVNLFLEAAAENLGATAVHLSNHGVSFELPSWEGSPCKRHAFHKAIALSSALWERGYRSRANYKVGDEVINFMTYRSIGCGGVGAYRVLAIDGDFVTIKKPSKGGRGLRMHRDNIRPMTRKNLLNQIITELGQYAIRIEGGGMFWPDEEQYYDRLKRDMPELKIALRDLFAAWRRLGCKKREKK